MPNYRKKCQKEECLQVAGELEVKAQIKLRINTATGQPVVIIRSFQVCLFQHSDPTNISHHACSWLLLGGSQCLQFNIGMGKPMLN